MNSAIPGKLAAYIHDMGMKALNHLAGTVQQPAEGTEPDALTELVGHWKTMTPAEKDAFVERVAASVGEVIAASARLPDGAAVGKKAVKSARKVLKRSARDSREELKKLKKVAKVKKTAKVKKVKKAAAPVRKPKKRAAAVKKKKRV